MCWHRYKYIGSISAHYWVGGVAGGIKASHYVNAKQCAKCGKLKEAS